jgi:hypothetical protein
MVGIETISGDALQLGRFSDSNLVIDKTATTLILAGEQVVDGEPLPHQLNRPRGRSP